MKNNYSILLTFLLCFSFSFSQTIQDQINSSEEGATVIIAPGTYAESLIIDKSITLEADGEVILDVSGLHPGILIDTDVSGVTIDGFTITGDASTGSGITVNPGSQNITIQNNTIQNILLPGGGNASPLSYGILCYGDSDPVSPPTNITIQGNSIDNVLGSAISLGSDTENVLIDNNIFSNITPVDLGTGTDTSIGIQAELSNGLGITNNTYNDLVISNNLDNCTSTYIQTNTYNNSDLMLSTTFPHSIVMSDAPWWSSTYSGDFVSFYEFYFNNQTNLSYLGLVGLGVYIQNSSNLGCTDLGACNYDDTANVDDGACDYADAGYDCDGNCLSDSDADGVCDADEVAGCQDETACNYDASATDNCDYDGDAVVDFEKENFADWTLSENRDLITPTCEITRQNNQGLYNYVYQNSYNNNQEGSNIEWKSGSYNEGGEYFNNLGDAFGGSLNALSGQTATLHIIDCDLYFELEFTFWQGGNNGGGFSYTRTQVDTGTFCDYADAGYDCAGVCLNDIDNDGICDEIDDCVGLFDECGICNGNGLTEYYDCQGNCLNDIDNDGICDEIEVEGCLDELACNYNENATDDDGLCVLPSYDESGTQCDECCTYSNGTWTHINPFYMFGDDTPILYASGENWALTPALFLDSEEIANENGTITTISTFGSSGDYTSFIQSNCYEGEVSIILTFATDGNDNIDGDIRIEMFNNSGMYFVSLTSVDNLDLNSGEMTGTILEGLSGTLIEIDFDLNGVGDCNEETSLIEDFASCSIYPNPSTGLVTISGNFSEEVVINVFDNLGQQVLSKKSTLDIRLDLSSFGKGLYFVQIAGANVYPFVID